MNIKHHLTLAANAFTQCSQCKLCNSECPVSLAGASEIASPAGAIAILGSLANDSRPQMLPPYSLDWCLLCGKCEKMCPAGLPLRVIFLQCKLLLKKQQKTRFLSKVKFFLCQNPALDFLHSFIFRIRKHKLKFDPAGKLKPVRFKKAFTSPNIPTVLLFPGCVAKRLRPEIAAAAASSLNQNGFHVLSPAGLHCCGKGEDYTHTAFKSHCRKNLKLLSALQFDHVAVLCPSCLHSIKEVWPNMAELSPREKMLASEIAAKTRYLAHFWNRPVPEPANSGDTIWHQGCVMDKEDGDTVTRILNLQRSANVNGYCCGGKYEEAKDKKQKIAKNGAKAAQKTPGAIIGRACRDAMVANKARAIATGCPHCLLSLENTFRNNGDKISVRHAAELYCENILPEPGGKS